MAHAGAVARPSVQPQRILAFILGGAGLLAPMAQAIYTPAIVEVRDGFGVSNAAAGFTTRPTSIFYSAFLELTVLLKTKQ